MFLSPTIFDCVANENFIYSFSVTCIETTVSFLNVPTTTCRSTYTLFTALFRFPASLGKYLFLGGISRVTDRENASSAVHVRLNKDALTAHICSIEDELLALLLRFSVAIPNSTLRFISMNPIYRIFVENI